MLSQHLAVGERPRDMPLPKTAMLGPAVGLFLAFALLSAAIASPAAGCSGGIAFDWAVAHTRGGILEARVVNSKVRADFTRDLEIAQPRVLQGDPSTTSRIHATEGYPCEQSADAGELVVLLFGVLRGPDEPPFPDGDVRMPLVYVIEGRDALEPSVVAAAFAQLPPTETEGLDAKPTEVIPIMALAVWIAAAGGLAIAYRRIEPRHPKREWEHASEHGQTRR